MRRWSAATLAAFSFNRPRFMGGGRTVMVGNLVQNRFTTARDWPFGSAVSVLLVLLVTALVVAMLRCSEEDLV